MVLMELSVLEQNKETWKKYNLDNMTMAEIFKKWSRAFRDESVLEVLPKTTIRLGRVLSN